MFVDRDMPAGVNFKRYLEEQVNECDVFLVAIGTTWAETIVRRQDDPRDFVRIEIELALKRSIPVVPLLIDDAQMPDPAKLPESIQEIALRQGIRVRGDPDFDGDAQALMWSLGGLGVRSLPSNDDTTGLARRVDQAALFGLIVCLVSIFVATVFAGVRDSPIYDSELEAMQFVVANAKYIGFENQLTEIQVLAGARSYQYYRTGDAKGQVTSEIPSSEEILQIESRRRSRFSEVARTAEWVAITSGSATAFAVSTGLVASKVASGPDFFGELKRATKGRGATRIASVVAFAASARFLAYELGYSDTRDYGNDVFQTVLTNARVYEHLAEECEKIIANHGRVSKAKTSKNLLEECER